MSTVKCKKCEDGYKVCDVKKTGSWVCEKCSDSIEAATMIQLFDKMADDIAQIDVEDLKTYEMQLIRFSKLLHPNHYLIVDLTKKATALLKGLSMSRIAVPGKRVINRLVQLRETLIPVARAVLPGISKIYAYAVYDFVIPFNELAERDYEDNDITLEEYLV